ncbi:hypothetical protein LJC55_02120, partial [Eubacteriales bacterium OttesenSCG-928-N14]|nr:hypothetical protein [Eubacteriales bacterium OttesenSCG-928-N14]
MTNAACVAVYVPFLFISILLLFSAVQREHKQAVVKQYILFCALLIVWLILEIAYFMVGSAWWMRFLLDIKLPIVALMPYATFILISNFYGITESYPKYMPYVLLIIPLITLLLALTTTNHTLLRGHFQVLQITPVHQLNTAAGPWYYVHAIYGVGLNLLNAVI